MKLIIVIILLDATFVDGTAPGSCVGETILTRTWTLTEDCGNSTVKIQTITIKDNTPPTFTEPGDITIYKDNNCNHNASVGVTGDVTDEDDNCDNTLDAIFSDVSVPGSCMGEADHYKDLVVNRRLWQQHYPPPGHYSKRHYSACYCKCQSCSGIAMASEPQNEECNDQLYSDG